MSLSEWMDVDGRKEGDGDEGKGVKRDREEGEDFGVEGDMGKGKKREEKEEGTGGEGNDNTGREVGEERGEKGKGVGGTVQDGVNRGRGGGGSLGKEGEGTYADTYWESRTGTFVGVNAAVIPCRHPTAIKGIAPHAHLSDGTLTLILVKECTKAQYLNQISRLANTLTDHLSLSFVVCVLT